MMVVDLKTCKLQKPLQKESHLLYFQKQKKHYAFVKKKNSSSKKMFKNSFYLSIIIFMIVIFLFILSNEQVFGKKIRARNGANARKNSDLLSRLDQIRSLVDLEEEEDDDGANEEGEQEKEEEEVEVKRLRRSKAIEPTIVLASRNVNHNPPMIH